MPRVKRSVHARKKRRKVLEQAKGYWGLKSTNYKYAKEQVERSLSYAYRDRKVRKREFRKLWIMRINAGARANGLSYNQFIAGLKAAEIELDRKVLADLAVTDPAKFGEIVEQARARRSRRNNGTSNRQAEIFRRQAAYCDGRSPLYADLCRRLADDPRVGDVAPDLRGTCRSGCSAACTTCVLAGEASWDDFATALDRPRGVPRGASPPSRTSRRTRCSAPGRCCPHSSRLPTAARSTCSSSARRRG